MREDVNRQLLVTESDVGVVGSDSEMMDDVTAPSDLPTKRKGDALDEASKRRK